MGGGGEISPRSRQIAVLDFDEILPQNAYFTMCKICDLFKIPKPKNKEFFESKMYGNLAAFVPFNLWVGGDFSENSAPPSTNQTNPYTITLDLNIKAVKERRGVLVHITSAQWYDNGNILRNYTCDLKSLLFNSTEFKSAKMQKIFSGEFGAEFSALRFYTSQAEAEFLAIKENIKVKNELCKAIAKALFEINSAALKNAKKKIKERDVLEYFKNNPLLAKEFANICQNAYAPLKSIRADILASWKYYNEFLDSIKQI